MKDINPTFGMISLMLLVTGIIFSFIDYNLFIYQIILLFCGCIFALLYMIHGQHVIITNRRFLSKNRKHK